MRLFHTITRVHPSARQLGLDENRLYRFNFYFTPKGVHYECILDGNSSTMSTWPWAFNLIETCAVNRFGDEELGKTILKMIKNYI